ncbi:MAG: RNA polymerase sporulation sigma factor SigH [Nitriliruptorales bacterium]|nr:RNA polymerase sporulation sigma factor SigH [Nitriliruptorales bacterium]
MAGTATPLSANHLETSLTDEELVDEVRDGNDDALTELLHRYRRFARAKARSYFLIGGDREDIVQEGMIGLYKAVRDYAAEHGASFRSFAELCITRQILTAIKTATRQKHSPLNTYVSFDRPHHGDPNRTVGDTIADPVEPDPLRRIVDSDSLAQLEAVCDEVLSELESDVLRLYVEGRSYQEIADQLGRHVKSIDNALQRIKRKLESRLRHRVA